MLEQELEPSFEIFDARILPIQYWASIRGRKDQEGERGLLLAVLEDAIRCYVANINARTRRQQLIFAEARNWFYPRDEARRRAPISFESICDMLGIEAGALRKRLKSINAADLPMNRRPVQRSRVTEPRLSGRQPAAKFGDPLRSASTDKRGRGRGNHRGVLSRRPATRR